MKCILWGPGAKFIALRLEIARPIREIHVPIREPFDLSVSEAPAADSRVPTAHRTFSLRVLDYATDTAHYEEVP